MPLEMADDFFTVANEPVQTELKIKGSRFIAGIFHASSQAKAEVLYNETKKKYYNASHNCYAYRIRNDLFRYSDDGEPSGTAGLPILKKIDSHRLFEVLLIVTRYFGGTKLGMGGLSRAYSDAAKSVLDSASIIKKTIHKQLRLQFSYNSLPEIQDIITKYKGIIDQSDYSDKIELICRIPVRYINNFQKEILHKIEITEL